MTAQVSLQDTAGTSSRALTFAGLPALLGVALAVHIVAAAAWIALFPQGSTDVVNFRRAAELVLSGQSPYASPANVYPPPYFWLLALLLRASSAVPVPFRFLMLTPAMLGDLAIVAWLWHVSRRHLPRARAARLVLLGGALSPPLVIISAVHGQMDSLPTLLAALACWVHGRRSARLPTALATGALLGAAIALKWFPVMLLPVLLLSARSHRARLAILVLSILPAGIALLPYLDGDPGAVLKQVFGYAGVFP